MSARETAWQAAADAVEALAPETDLIARADPADFGKSVLSVLGRAAARRRARAVAPCRRTHAQHRQEHVGQSGERQARPHGERHRQWTHG